MNKSVAGRYFDYPQLSFYSLLQSKELYFVNPIEKPDVTCLRNEKGFCQCGEESVKDCRDMKWQWQQAESKVIKGKLVILKSIL